MNAWSTERWLQSLSQRWDLDFNQVSIMHSKGLKYCPDCKIWLDRDKFFKDLSKVDNLCYRCKTCDSKRRAARCANSPKQRMASYRQGARKRDLVFELSIVDFENLVHCSCTYCGSKHNIGFDRIDNSIGYTKENCVPCCITCNRMKSNHNVQKWLFHMTKIIKFFKGEN